MKCLKVFLGIFLFFSLFIFSGNVRQARADVTIQSVKPWGGGKGGPVSVCQGATIAVTVQGNVNGYTDTSYQFGNIGGYQGSSTYNIAIPTLEGEQQLEIFSTDVTPNILIYNEFYNILNCSSLTLLATNTNPNQAVFGQFITFNFTISGLIGANSTAAITINNNQCNPPGNNNPPVPGVFDPNTYNYDYSDTCLIGTNNAGQSYLTVIVTVTSAGGGIVKTFSWPSQIFLNPTPQCQGDPTANQINLYYNANYDPSGGCWTLSLTNGTQITYPNAYDPLIPLLPPATISSIKVGSNVQVKLYDLPGLADTPYPLSSNTNYNLPDIGWNDKMQSLEIDLPPTPIPPTLTSTPAPIPTNPPTLAPTWNPIPTPYPTDFPC